MMSFFVNFSNAFSLKLTAQFFFIYEFIDSLLNVNSFNWKFFPGFVPIFEIYGAKIATHAYDLQYSQFLEMCFPEFWILLDGSNESEPIEV